MPKTQYLNGYEVSMCLSNVYIQSNDRRIKVMEDVAQLESNQDGYLLIGLSGDQEFVRGKIKSVDFVDDYTVVLEEDKKLKGGNNDTSN